MSERIATLRAIENSHILIYASGLEWIQVLNVTGLGVVFHNNSLTYSLESSCTSQWHHLQLVELAEAFGGRGWAHYCDTHISITLPCNEDTVQAQADLVQSLIAILETDRAAPEVKRPAILG